MSEEESSWLDRLEGYAITMLNSDSDSPGWVCAWEMVLNFVKQERLGVAEPLQFMAVPVGYEPNGYIIHPASHGIIDYEGVEYDVQTHAEE